MQPMGTRRDGTYCVQRCVDTGHIQKAGQLLRLNSAAAAGWGDGYWHACRSSRVRLSPAIRTLGVSRVP